jgi:Holliday junction resolvase
MELTIRVFGRPAPQGSKRLNKYGGVAEMSKYLKPWKKLVQRAIEEITGGKQIFPRNTPVKVDMVFYLKKPSRPLHRPTLGRATLPVTAPDKDKLERAVNDALTASGIWFDDAQSNGGSVWKLYESDTEPQGVRITMKAL